MFRTRGYMVYSMKHQIVHLRALFEDSGLGDQRVLLRELRGHFVDPRRDTDFRQWPARRTRTALT